MTAPTPPSNNGYPAHPPSGPNNPSPTAELTGLAAYLRRVADRVNELDTRCDHLAETLSATVLPQLDRIATDTAAQLAQHTEQTQQLLDTLTTHRATAPPDWAAMTVEQAAAVWDDLADWIADTLVPWYEITRDQLPDCWALHRPALIPLSWLHHTYKAVHQPGTPPRASAEWHTRWLPAALNSITAAIPRRGIRTCGPGQHLINPGDGLRNHPPHPVGHRPNNQPQPTPGNQLAERHHWQCFYAQGKAADLQLRAAEALRVPAS